MKYIIFRLLYYNLFILFCSHLCFSQQQGNSISLWNTGKQEFKIVKEKEKSEKYIEEGVKSNTCPVFIKNSCNELGDSTCLYQQEEYIIMDTLLEKKGKENIPLIEDKIPKKTNNKEGNALNKQKKGVTLFNQKIILLLFKMDSLI